MLNNYLDTPIRKKLKKFKNDNKISESLSFGQINNSLEEDSEHNTSVEPHKYKTNENYFSAFSDKRIESLGNLNNC